MVLVSPTEQPDEANGSLRFLPDSTKQIEESIERMGPLWNQLCNAFRAAIVRVHKGQQESDRPAIDETKEDELKDESLLK